jgi:DNA replication and repair protein RecF
MRSAGLERPRVVRVFVDHLQLADFRSYLQVDVPLGSGVTTFVGANGQGKTNLVEAVEYVSTLSSHRVSSEVPLVRFGAERAVVRARVQAGLDDPRQLQLEVEITPGKANRAKLNRSPLRRSRELIGVLRTVVFSPEDLAIVKGDPSERRRFLDELVVARWPRFAGVRADYDRVLKQRSTLLKSLSGRSRGGPPPAEAASTLDVWDAHLATAGAELLAARLRTLAELAPHVSSAYADIAPTNSDVAATYKSSLELTAELTRDEIVEVMTAGLLERRPDEIQRGLCLVGPHRDDVVLTMGPMPAKGYASHGESWSYALALRLAAYDLLRADGDDPILILDDVFAELDAERRGQLAELVAGAEQVLVTAAVDDDVPEKLAGVRFRVAGGEVTRVD